MVRVDVNELLGDGVSPRQRALRARAVTLLERAIDAVDPMRATMRALRTRDLGPVWVFAFGKAAVPMTRAALASADVRGGVVVAPDPSALEGAGLRLFRGGHPRPLPDAPQTGRAVMACARRLGPEDVALCLISGGGSAMLELPRVGIDLDALVGWVDTLGAAGANIEELNAFRRGLSQIKGGGLLEAIHPARVVNLVVSDVPGLAAQLVASGPTCTWPGGPSPRDVAERHGLWQALPQSAQAVLENTLRYPPRAPDTEVIADNAMARAATGLPDRGILLAGEARRWGARIARAPFEGEWVVGGETTVTVTGSGRGGRSLELALSALAEGWSEGVLLASGTDGVDGSSPFAGALIDAPALAQARRRGLDPQAYLAANDSAAFFEKLGTGLSTGPTETNVADLCFMLRAS